MLTDMRLYFATSFGHYNITMQWPLPFEFAIVLSLSSHPYHLIAAISRVDIPVVTMSLISAGCVE